METKIDRGFFDTQRAYKKMICENINESIDEDTYKSYIIVKCKDGTEKIESGWDYAEDAKDRKNELKEDGIPSRCVTRRYLRSIGLDPADVSNWLMGNVSELAIRKDENASTIMVMRRNNIVESDEYDEQSATIEDWIESTFAYQMDSDSDKVKEYVREFLSKRGYNMSDPIEELDEGVRQMLEDNAGDILYPLERENLQ